MAAGADQRDRAPLRIPDQLATVAEPTVLAALDSPTILGGAGQILPGRQELLLRQGNSPVVWMHALQCLLGGDVVDLLGGKSGQLYLGRAHQHVSPGSKVEHVEDRKSTRLNSSHL